MFLTRANTPCFEFRDFLTERYLCKLNLQSQIPVIRGDITNHPDLLWAEDSWDETRIADAKEKIRRQGACSSKMSDFNKNRILNKASQYWHEFYKRNQDHFYKDRHYLHIVFPELAICNDGKKVLVELGSGVGNAIFPLLTVNDSLQVLAFDFAKSAIDLMKINPLYDDLNNKCRSLSACDDTFKILGQVCDIVHEELPISDNSVDYVLCMFVLSAMPRTSQLSVFKKISRILKPSGKVFFRDYGRYDEAQLRFSGKNIVDDNLYARQDGTLSYYFTKEEVFELALSAGLKVLENEYVLRQYANRKQGKARYRVWMHGKFIK